MHESTTIETKQESKTDKIRFEFGEEDYDKNNSELELKALVSSSSSMSRSAKSNLSPHSTTLAMISSADVKQTITDFLIMKRQDSASTQDSAPTILRHYSKASFRTTPATALSRPLTSSTRPVTSASHSVMQRNNDSKTQTSPKAVGQKRLSFD